MFEIWNRRSAEGVEEVAVIMQYRVRIRRGYSSTYVRTLNSICLNSYSPAFFHSLPRPFPFVCSRPHSFIALLASCMTIFLHHTPRSIANPFRNYLRNSPRMSTPLYCENMEEVWSYGRRTLQLTLPYTCLIIAVHTLPYRLYHFVISSTLSQCILS